MILRLISYANIFPYKTYVYVQYLLMIYTPFLIVKRQSK